MALVLVSAVAQCAQPAQAPASPAGVVPETAAGSATRLTVGALAGGWAPFEMIENGRLTGLSADYLRALAGPDVEIEPKTFPDMQHLMAAACAGKVDVLTSVARSPERERCVSFTAPYFRASISAVVNRNGRAVLGPADLARARFAVEKGFAFERLLRERFPHARIETRLTTAEALRAVAQGNADAYLGFTPAVQYLLAKGEFGALHVAFEERTRTGELRFAVPRDRAALRDRFDRALATMHPADETVIRARWLGDRFGLQSTLVEPRLVLSPEEQTWLRSLPPLQVGFDSGWPPFSYLDESGRPAGIASEYLDYVERTLGIVFARTTSADWPAVVGAFQRGELAMLGTVGEFDAVGFSVRPDLAPLAALIDRALLAMPQAEKQRIRRKWVTGNAGGHDGWSVTAVRLLPLLIGIGFVLLVTLRAYLLLQREVRLREQTEKALALQLNFQQSVMEMVPFPLFAKDLDGRYIALNRAFEESTGLRREDTIGRLSSEVNAWGESNSRLLEDMTRSMLKAGRRLQIELQFVGRGGEMRHGLFWTGLCNGIDAEPTCVLGTMADITDIRRAERLAEAASRAKDDFFAMMSHEIRTPMNGVLGLVEVLERTPLNAQQGEMLGMIQESAGALLQILDDLLDYSKIGAGHLMIEAEPIDIRELVDNVVGLLAGRAHEKGLKVHVDIASGVAASLRGDSVRLRQILFNLLGNAIKFTPAGDVGVRVAVVGQTAQEQTLDITVEDTGIGIAREVQARLFEPFVQAESSTTRRFGGTGLGLAICRKLIDLMNGALELQSTPGAGTRMAVRLALPVVARRYAAGGLRGLCGLCGKRGVVAIGDSGVAQALMHFCDALGIELRRLLPSSAELSDPVAMAGAELIFLNDGFDLPTAVRAGSRVIRLTEKPKPTGYRVVDGTVRLSVNPISWRGLGAACMATMTGSLAARPHTQGLHDASEAPKAPKALEAPQALTLAMPEIRDVPPDRAQAIASGRLILVAEDHPVNQELIRHQLALLGFACDIVNDGTEALAALEHTRYGFVITDCQMPNLSGYELARRIRAKEQEQGQRGARRLPILGITANTVPEDLSLCRDAGMDDYLVKPTRLATLQDYLSRRFGADGPRQPAPPEPSGEPQRAPDTRARAAADSFVPVDLAHMTQLWGSESTVKTLLDAFVTSVRDDVTKLPSLLEPADVERLREWHHRVMGAAGILQYAPLLAALEAYRRDLASKTPERLRAEGLKLAARCNAMLDGIEAQAALLV